MSTALLLPTLDAHDGASVGEQLQAALVELIALSLYGKQLHWSVVGPNFRPLHLQLDEFVDTWRDLSDAVAERAVAIGRFPDGQAGAVAAVGAITPIMRGPVDGAEVVRCLAESLASVCGRMRERMNALAELDVASQDVIVGIVRALEEQLWMVRAQLPDGDA